MMYVQALLLAACCFAPSVLGVIHNLEKHQEDELVQPLAIDISPDDDLGDIAEELFGTDFSTYRNERQTDDGSSEPSVDIGTITRLPGTTRHYFALVHWTGHPSEVLFIVTMTRRNNPTDSCLWRSTDYGKTFTNDTYKLNDSSVVIQWYYVSPQDNNIIMADARQDKIFVTRDEGESFIGYDLDFTPNKLRFQKRGIPNGMEGDLPKHVLGYDQTRQQLHVSRDLGETWTYLGSNVSRYRWRVLEEQYEASSALYYEEDINATHALLMVTEDPYNVSRPLDQMLGPIAINSSVLSNEFILVQKPVNWSLGEEYSSPLWVSNFRRPFQQANFPLQIQEEHYAVMDASENRVFLAVQHLENETVHLYISDREGLDYSLSLDDIVATEDWKDESPSFDIHVVSGLQGTYLVNRYNRLLVDMDNPDTGPMVSTVISYNKGGQWGALAAPAVDKNNVATLCQPPQCSLHLRMDTDKTLGYTSILSKRSAIGLILAQGNIGSSLTTNISLLHVYLSRDGGFTWQEIEEGHWSFQTIALGSILVMAQKRYSVETITSVLWSCDEGASWTEFVFSLTPMRFVGMLPEKGEKARHITVFGYYWGVQFAWLIIELDFSDAVPNQCSQPDDYFTWIPSDGRPTGLCVLGSMMTYERRRSDVCCYIDPNYERPVSNLSCPCTWEDYECDVGYEQMDFNGPCLPTDPINGPAPTIPVPADCPEGATFLYSSGYRKIVGDVCTETEQAESPFTPLNESCPAVAPDGLSIMIQEDISHGITANQNLTFILTQKKGWTGITIYTWDFGDGVTVSGAGLRDYGNQSHSYDSTGSYVVRVTASNDAGSNVASLVVRIDDVAPGGLRIEIMEDGNSGYSAGQALQFTLIQEKGWKIYTLYTWDFGDNVTVSGVGLLHFGIQFHSYDKDGRYVVTVTASNHVGNDSTSLTVSIGDLAPGVLSITVNGDLSSAGNSLTFNLTQEKGLTAPTRYEWDFGDNVTISGVGLQKYGVQSHTYEEEGDYTVTVTASNEDGMSSTSLIISIGDFGPGVLSITVNGDLSSAGNSLTFNLTQEKGLTAPTRYEWDFGDNVTISGVGLQKYGVQSHTYEEEGDYTVTVTASNEDGMSSTSLIISIGDFGPGVLSITVNGDLSSAGNSLTFNLTQEKGLTAPTRYEWDFGDNVTISGVGLQKYGVQSHTYEEEGDYTVTVTASNEYGMSSTSLIISIGDFGPGGLSITVKGDLSSAGNSLTFNLTQEKGLTAPTRYEWDFGDNVTISGVGLQKYGVQSHTYEEEGDYTVTVTASNEYGMSSTSRIISIGDFGPGGLSITVKGDLSSAGNSLTFNLTQEKGLTAPTRYKWDFGDNVIISGVGLQKYGVQSHTYEKEGDYTVTVTASNEDGMSSASLIISIGDFGPGGLSITVKGDLSSAGNSLTFTLTQEKGLTVPTQYKWDFGDNVTISGVGLVQSHTYEKEGDYTVTVTASNEDGMSSASLIISIGVKLGKVSSGDEKKRQEVGLGVGLTLTILIIGVVVVVFIGIVWWYRRRYHTLQARYRTLQEGTVPMTLSPGELQEDFGCSKDIDDSDEKVLISDKDEV